MNDFNTSNNWWESDANHHFGHLVHQTTRDVADKTKNLTSREKEIERRAQVCSGVLLQEYRKLVEESPLDAYHDVWKSDVFKDSVKQLFENTGWYEGERTRINLLERVRDIIFENERLYSERPAIWYFEKDSPSARLNVSETQFR